MHLNLEGCKRPVGKDNLPAAVHNHQSLQSGIHQEPDLFSGIPEWMLPLQIHLDRAFCRSKVHGLEINRHGIIPVKVGCKRLAGIIREFSSVFEGLLHTFPLSVIEV